MTDTQSDLTQPEPQKPPETASPLRFLYEILQTIVLALVLYFLIDMILGRVRVENVSMLPTLQPEEYILVNKFAYRLGDFHRGDIVVFHYPYNPEEDFIKRTIGLPGEEVRVANGLVYINGQPLDEPYISAPPVYSDTWVVPEGHIFVLGDNRNKSSDSHSWGFVPKENVVGKAVVIYWPLEQFKLLNKGSVVEAAQ